MTSASAWGTAARSEGLEPPPSDPQLAAERSMKVAGAGQNVRSGR